MRDVYYQSVGNPVQYHRLPATRPEMELLPPLTPQYKQFLETAKTLVTAAGLALSVFIVYRLPGITWLEPYDLLVSGPVFVAGLVIAITTADVRWLIHPAFFGASGLLFANYRTPWALQVFIVSLTIAIHVYCFGQHWSHVCTATPVRRFTARQLRAKWQWQLFLLAIMTGVMTAVVFCSQTKLLVLAAAMLPLALIATSSPAGLRTSRWRIARDSLFSWMTYEAQPLPGLLQSPIASAFRRRCLTVFASIMIALMFIRWCDSPLPYLIRWGYKNYEAVTHHLDNEGADAFRHMRYDSLTWGLTVIAALSLPMALPSMLAIALTTPILLEATSQRDQAQSTHGLLTLFAEIRRSPDLRERHSVYLGRVVADGSPVLVPRSVFREHAHGLGDTGSGKTSLFLCPLIEQLVALGDCSVIVLDLKADTPELLATLQSAAEIARRERGVKMPVNVFSNQAGRATFAFNPLDQPFWKNFDHRTRTDMLCGAGGLTYGVDYGPGYYSSANAAVLHAAMMAFPDVRTFRKLADCIGHVMANAKKRDLHPEIRKAGAHVQEVIKRLGDCRALNVTDHTGHSRAVVENAIDLARVFREPRLLYFHLSATLSPSGAPEIARLVTYMLLAAATQTERRHQVYLVIDEFQRMVAANLEYMLQLARSMGVGVIVANQSMEDLKKPTTNLIPALEANCRLRNWYGVSSIDDQKRLIESSGLTVDRLYGRSRSTDSQGRESVSYSESETVVNRVTSTDVALTTDHPFRSFLRITHGADYAQYGGLPVIIESSYHISEEEYLRRKSIPWPAEPGTLIASYDDDDTDGTATLNTPATPKIPYTEEVIGGPKPLPKADLKAINGLFEQFQQRNPGQKRSSGESEGER